MAAAAQDAENPIIQYIKDQLKSQAETRARLENAVEEAKGFLAASKTLMTWLDEHPEVRKFVRSVKWDDHKLPAPTRRALDKYPFYTPLELMQNYIESMRSALGSFGLSDKASLFSHRIHSIANMVKHQNFPGPKACENLARLAKNKPDADRSELRQDLLNLGQRMQEAYDWIKQEKKKNKE